MPDNPPLAAAIHRKTVVLYRRLPPPLRARLDQAFDVVDFSHADDLPGNRDFQQALAEAHGLLGAGITLDRPLLEQAPLLEVVSSLSVGVDHYDLTTLAERDITLCHTPDVLNDSVADAALLLMLATARRAIELSDMVRQGQWKASLGESMFGIDIHHKRLGIVGMGRIGAAIARRAALGFSMSVTYHNRSGHSAVDAELGANWQPLPQLLAESDIVCATVPLSNATRDLFDAAAFAQMPRHAIFINVARGGVVDETALVEALTRGDIHAAGLDVFSTEPLPVDSALISLPNVVTLPHMGSATHETRYKMAELAVDNLISVLNGQQPPAAYPLFNNIE